MTGLVLDYSFWRPNPVTLKRGGVVAVMRYLSGKDVNRYDTKDLSLREAQQLLAAGIGIGLVWETTSTRANQGFAAGLADAKAANHEADLLGVTMGTPIVYAVDYAAAGSDVVPYFEGVMSVRARPVGVYGSADVVDRIGNLGVPWLWQTVAWSNHRRTHAHLYQYYGHPHSNFSSNRDDYDDNDLLLDFPFWGRPAPTDPPPTKEEVMANLGKLNAGICRLILNPGPEGGGWFFATDGGVFPWGGAPGWGSHGGEPLNAPIKDVLVNATGYTLCAEDGGTFPYGPNPPQVPSLQAML